MELLTDSIKRRRDFDTRTMTGYYLRGIVPGWGQIYADHTFKGSMFLASTVLLTGFTIYSWKDWSDKKSDYDALTRYDSQAEFDSKYNAKKNAAIMTYSGIGALGVIYALNWFDLIFYSKPNYKSSDIAKLDLKVKHSSNGELSYSFAYNVRF